MAKIKDSQSSVDPVEPDHYVWSRLFAFFDRPISDETIEAFRLDPDLQRYASGDTSVLARLLDRIEALENQFAEAWRNARLTAVSPVHESSIQHTPEIDDLRRRWSTREPMGRVDHDFSANYLGVVSGIGHRIAEVNEAKVLGLVRQVLVRYDPEFKDEPEVVAKMLSATPIRGCPTGARLLATLEEIARAEHPHLQADLAEAASQLDEFIVATTRGACPVVWRARYQNSKKLSVSVEVASDSGIWPTYVTKQVRILTDTGFLFALSRAAAVLAAKYQWGPEGALHFLCVDGAYPVVKIASIDFDMRRNPTALTRINLTIDPTLSPEEVKRIYAHARSQVLPHSKELSTKSLLLAFFVYAQNRPIPPAPDAPTWLRLMHEWNERFGVHIKSQRSESAIYSDLAKFKRDAMIARDRLLDPKLTEPQSLSQFPSLSVFRGPAAPNTNRKRK